MIISIFSIVVFLLSIDIKAYSQPGACDGSCFSHDPSLIQHTDGTWFRFNTGNGIGIWKAPALHGPWTYVGDALKGGSVTQIAGRGDLWAPDVTRVGTMYYMYYAVSQFGKKNSAIGFATSSTMEAGSWTDHGGIGVESSDSSRYNAIDPSLLVSGNDYYLVFGSWNQGIYQVAMESPPNRKTGSSSSNHLAYVSRAPHTGEGPTMFHHDGWYYLLYSSGICCGYQNKKPAPGDEYKIVMCRSNSPTSGFHDKAGVDCLVGGGTTLLESHDNVYGPGGQGVIDTPDGLLLYYHYTNPQRGIADADNLFGYNYLSFSDGWPAV
ncbi:family 43 glycoside hydrolase [Melampsora larici-populina 98AG31]|uniref:Arabinan endo-1,5-alpha-L-arabinosidase n=1 Tax=Melampsora larici-populina (strain 98AG31 / pathotype 3-4-7) TaxID=747676 RepID=F4S209_MELLP|nr:family 43 glycoside hydrolase [Melampsora larici-populina 98AG31]EGG01282.1 family 43 glycoside hydrolase [Melampsora larici-populina 98AG31]